MIRLRIPVLLLVAGSAWSVDADPLLEPVTRQPPVPPRVAPHQPLPREPMPLEVEKPSLPMASRLPGEGIGDQWALMPAPVVLWIRWDDYRTVIVIEQAGGRELPAWVATYDGVTSVLAVAYRAVARRDVDGTLRIDARAAVIAGPQARQWSPDSFIIGADRLVSTHDDEPSHPGNHGEVEKLIDAKRDPAEYLRILRSTQAEIGGGT